MHLRRAALLMALVLGVVALVEAVVPVPRQRGRGALPLRLATGRPGPPPRTVTFRYPAPRRLPRVRVAGGAHVVVQVVTATAGQASVGGLGLDQPAEPDTPARFDVLATQPGTYGVAFDPASGGGTTLGRIVVAAPG